MQLSHLHCIRTMQSARMVRWLTVRDPYQIAEIVERYWRYVFWPQTIGPTLGYHDSQAVARLGDFGPSQLAWTAATLDLSRRYPPGWQAASFSRENPAVGQWLDLMRRFQPTVDAARVLSDLDSAASGKPSWCDVVAAGEEFLGRYPSGIAKELLSLAELLPAADLSPQEIVVYCRTLAAEMLSSPAGSWYARNGFLDVCHRLGAGRGWRNEVLKGTIEFNLDGLTAEADVEIAPGVRILAGCRLGVLPPALGSDEDANRPAIEHPGARVAVDVEAPQAEIEYVAMSRAREALAVFDAAFGAGTEARIRLGAAFFSTRGHVGWTPLGREQVGLILMSKANQLAATLQAIHRREVATGVSLTRAALFHQRAYFETFYPWSTGFGVAYDHAALEELAPQGVDPWRMTEDWAIAASPVRALFNSAFLIDTLANRGGLDQSDTIGATVLEALQMNPSPAAVNAIFDAYRVDDPRRVLLVSAIFGADLQPLLASTQDASWGREVAATLGSQVQQARHLRNRMVHSSSSDAPAGAIVASFLDHQTGTLWKAVARGTDLSQIRSAADDVRQRGLPSKRSLEAVAWGF